MNITFKMYASLAKFLPPEAERNSIQIDIPATWTIHDIIDRYRVPRASAHLILVNGVYVDPPDRDKPVLRENDVLALWPSVAGG